jgi:hypothetical protein
MIFSVLDHITMISRNASNFSPMKRKRSMYYRSALRTTLIVGLLVMFITSQASRAFAGANANIGTGNTISTLVIDPAMPDTIYAGANDGVFKSINGGGSWNATNTGLTANPVKVMVIDPLTPTTLYAGIGGDIFKSTNNGATWSAISTDLAYTNISALAIDPITPTILYAGTSYYGVFKSINGGQTWNMISIGVDTDVKALAIDPLTPTTLYAGTLDGVFKSTDSGDTWVNTGITSALVTTLVIDPLTPTTLYAGTRSEGVFKSTNGAGDWSHIGPATVYISTMTIDPLTPTTLYVGSESSGAFKSTDGGENWIAINTGLTTVDIRSLAINPASPTTLYTGTGDAGIFKSTDGGENWNAVNDETISTSTPTLIPTATSTSTPSMTPTPIATSTSTTTPTRTSTLTTTPTRTITRTPTITSTPSNTSTGTITATFTPTRTVTASRTITSTPSKTSTGTITATFTPTLTSTRTLTSTLTSTATITATPIAPGAFAKISPANSAGGTTIYPTLSWETSSAATRYEYCYDTTNNNVCNGTWTSTGMSTSVTLSGLSNSTTYYWQVRAVNVSVPTYANNDTWWNFTTIIAPPGAFKKSYPNNSASGADIRQNIGWETNFHAVSYEYCFDTTNDDNCSNTWNNVGHGTNWELSGLSSNTTYYWQVRAINAGGETYADDGTWWSFTTIAHPIAFNKINPTDSSSEIAVNSILSWEASSDVDHYEYCYNIDNDDICNTSWQNVGTNTSSGMIELNYATTYYWQVRAVNAVGEIDANDGTWWSFTTIAPPIVFSKISPELWSERVVTNPILSWEPSSGVAYYEYCFDTTGDNNCDGTWVSTGTSTSSELTGLDYSTTYYWQVRAVNNDGIIYANHDSWWSFTTNIAPPDMFNKTSPADAAGAVAVKSTLSWEASNSTSGIYHYEYCYDTIDDDNCNETWISVDNNSAPIWFGNETTYYWQVKAINDGGETYANHGVWWSFTTSVELPDVFNKTGPDNSSNGVAINPTLSWETSGNSASYEYCYDTTNDNTCGGTWSNTGTNNNSELSGLSYNTTYYWQVRAISAGGETYANDGAWWSFSTISASTTSIKGSVTLQGRPAKPNARWSVPLNVSLTTPGNTQPAYTFTPTTDTYGKFTLTGIVPGTYEVRVKHSHTLQRLKTVTLTSGMTAINFGTLLEGDANNDNRISTADLLILATTYGKCQGISGYDPRADFNGDICITSRDFSLLAKNYGKTGASLAADPVDEPISLEPSNAEVNISIDPVSNPVRVGKTFTVAIRVQAGSVSVDGIQASLDFDPTKLRVKKITGNPSLLPEVLLNTYDNTTGTVDYAAGSLSSSLTGDITLVQIEFEAIAKTDATSISFHHGFLRNTEVTFGDGSILKKDTDLTISIADSYKIFQPLMTR